MFERKACVISGGGAWGAFGAGTLARLNNNYDTIVGVSTGSLIAPLAILREWEFLKAGYTSVNNNNIFDSYWYKPQPLRRDGKLNKLAIIISLLFGEKTISTSHALRKTIDDFFPQEMFDKIREKNKEVLVGTQNYAQVPSKIHYFSSMNESYEDFKDWMWCSANFPFFTSLVKKSWRNNTGSFHMGLWSDGGLTDLVGVDQLFRKGFKEIDIILHRVKQPEVYEGHKIYNLMDNVNTSISAMRYDIEFEFFYNRIRRLNREGAKVTVYWLPRKLSTNSMVFNQEEMLSWWEEGYNTALDKDRIEIFSPDK